ncbi:uncharacterized protein LOC129596813 [Paramacrobiotus metropolitanus]|uniref:uncharacterized protein LOC129596813 n=1 Tax=Paramacrobiotus metropolitanus TaxID=2943436 RepID=UPI002445882A|nr:uncharacterized protein LOC129596813 [Paramacrobiotus metropolitanus]
MALTAVFIIFSAVFLILDTGKVAAHNQTCSASALDACLTGAPAADIGNPAVTAILERARGHTLPYREFTQQDMNAVCRVASFAGPCLENHIKTCLSPTGNVNGSNFHQFLSASRKILAELCARPNLLNDEHQGSKCLHVMARYGNESSCDDYANAENPLQCHNASVWDFPQHQVYFQENDVLGHLCCSFNKAQQCAAKGTTTDDKASMCSVDARRLAGELLGIMEKGYMCADRVKYCSIMSQRIRTPSNNCRLPGESH